jgi:hypothetical protein
MAVKVTVTLDEELARELERSGNVSAQLNEAGWALVERRRSVDRLATLLDDLDRADGALPPDPEEDARIDRLLSGVF